MAQEANDLQVWADMEKDILSSCGKKTCPL